MSKRDEVKEQLRNILSEELITYTGITVTISQAYINKLINQILALEGLAIVDREARLPENPYLSVSARSMEQWHDTAICEQARQEMIREGWVKEVN